MKLNIGCGDNLLQGWINADVAPAHTGVIQMDARIRLPYDDGELEAVFTEHMIEHMHRNEAQLFLRECVRVLSPSGWLRIATPDLALVVAAYQGAIWNAMPSYITYYTGSPDDRVGYINRMMHDWGHTFLWDEASLRAELEHAGFTSVMRDTPNLLHGHGKILGEANNNLETLTLLAHK